jgi:glycosyltransferase involved in cell wall biosynthesis
VSRRVVSVIVPVYFNEQSLPGLFDELKAVEQQLEQRDVGLELIFIDDGSADASLKTLLDFKQRRPATKVLKHTRNFGSGQAIKSGLQYVTGDCFLFLAADCQDPPALIVQTVDRWLAGKKYVVAARESRKDPMLSKLFAGLYYKLLGLFVVKDYPRGGFDLALMDKSILAHMRNAGKNVNLNLFGYWLGYEPEVISYERQNRSYGKSRWTTTKKIKLLLDSLLGFSVAPIRIISLIGLVVAVVSLGYGTTVLVAALLGSTEVRGFAALATLISFLLGLIIVMLGVIGEYLWRIADETNRRPDSVIDEVF